MGETNVHAPKLSILILIIGFFSNTYTMDYHHFFEEKCPFSYPETQYSPLSLSASSDDLLVNAPDHPIIDLHARIDALQDYTQTLEGRIRNLEAHLCPAAQQPVASTPYYQPQELEAAHEDEPSSCVESDNSPSFCQYFPTHAMYITQLPGKSLKKWLFDTFGNPLLHIDSGIRKRIQFVVNSCNNFIFTAQNNLRDEIQSFSMPFPLSFDECTTLWHHEGTFIFDQPTGVYQCDDHFNAEAQLLHRVYRIIETSHEERIESMKVLGTRIFMLLHPKKIKVFEQAEPRVYRQICALRCRQSSAMSFFSALKNAVAYANGDTDLTVRSIQSSYSKKVRQPARITALHCVPEKSVIMVGLQNGRIITYLFSPELCQRPHNPDNVLSPITLLDRIAAFNSPVFDISYDTGYHLIIACSADEIIKTFRYRIPG